MKANYAYESPVTLSYSVEVEAGFAQSGETYFDDGGELIVFP